MLAETSVTKGGFHGHSDFMDLPAGKMSNSEIDRVLPYNNTICALKLNGRQIIEWLETSAGNFNKIDPNTAEDQYLVNYGFDGHHFDHFWNITYMFDVTQPAGQRVSLADYNGEPLTEDDVFLVLADNFRAGGGGGLPHAEPENIVMAWDKSYRDLLVEYLNELDGVIPELIINWSIKPVGTEGRVLFRTGSEWGIPVTEYMERAAELGVEPVDHISYVGTEEVWGLFEIDLASIQTPHHGHIAEVSEPRQVILTWQNDPQSTMTITWRTDHEAQESLVFYSLDSEQNLKASQTAQAEVYTFEETAAWVNSVELTGLRPGTTYWVVLDSDGVQSEPFNFRTAPAESEDLIFVIGADAQQMRTQMSVIREVFRKAASDEPDVFICSGDFVNAELSDYEWDLFFDVWDELLITKDGRRIPIIPAIGNHEVVAGFGGVKELAPFYYNRFRLPKPEKYHVLQYGPDFAIFSLDSNHTSPVDGEQKIWLENTLAELQEIPWILVHHHVGSWWGSQTLDAMLRTYWVPLFEQYNVDLVHSGHYHSYVRTAPILGISEYVSQLDDMIENALARAAQDFDSDGDYLPPRQENLLQLSRGGWEDLGLESLNHGLEEMLYMLALYVIQTGNAGLEDVVSQITHTQLFQDFWDPVLNSPENYGLVDDKRGVTYLVGGGLGASLGDAIGNPVDHWWMEEADSVYHYRRLVFDADRNQLTIEPIFYDPGADEWEAGTPVVLRK